MAITYTMGEVQTVCQMCGEVVHASVPFAAAGSDLRLAVKACLRLTDDGDLAHTLIVEVTRMGEGEL